MNKLGFTTGLSNPCIFYHPKRHILTMVHGDDFASTAANEDLEWLRQELEKEFLLKTDVIGPGNQQKREVKILNRIIRYTRTGIEYEADARHSELIIKQLGLEQAKPLSSPAIDDEPKAPDENEVLHAEYSTQFKSITMRASYLSHDRSDLQFAVKRLAQNIANPTSKDWQRLNRLGRYILGTRRIVYHYRWQSPNSVLTLNTDSDFAGDRGTRKSTSSGVLRIGGHFIKSWSKGQSLIALSSVEAELYAILKGVSEALGYVHVSGLGAAALLRS